MTELARLVAPALNLLRQLHCPMNKLRLFLDPSQPMDVQVYADLSEMGFRRSGDHLYRPHCLRCDAYSGTYSCGACA